MRLVAETEPTTTIKQGPLKKPGTLTASKCFLHLDSDALTYFANQPEDAIAAEVDAKHRFLLTLVEVAPKSSGGGCDFELTAKPSADGARSYEAQLLGFVEAEHGEVTRFDLVALGDYEGEGRYTRGAPKGKFPFAVSFTLADGDDVADAVPPQGSRGWLKGYLRAERR